MSAVNCKATVPPAGDYYPLPNYNVNNVILYVPKGTLSAYKQSPIWRIFTNMKEMDASGIEVVPENDIYEVARYSVDGKQLLRLLHNIFCVFAIVFSHSRSSISKVFTTFFNAIVAQKKRRVKRRLRKLFFFYHISHQLFAAEL